MQFPPPNNSNLNEATVELLNHYIEMCAASATRARTILIVMISASVLTFFAFWNTREDAWLTQRLIKATAAIHLFDTKGGGWLSESEARREFISVDDVTYEEAKKFIKLRKLDNRELLTHYIQTLREIQAQQVTTLHAPFFGVTFDVNDLGMFSGFTFFVVLLWFRFSLVRELNNLTETFHEAKNLGEEYRRHCYNLLAMRQMLTVPPMRQRFKEASSNVSGWGLWRVFNIFLFVMPICVYALLVWHDLKTLYLATSVSKDSALFLVLSNLAFLILILALTALCFQLSRRIDKQWRDEARSLGIIFELPGKRMKKRPPANVKH